MANEEIQFDVPIGFELEAKTFVDMIRRSYQDSSDEIGLAVPATKGLDAEVVLNSLLWMTTGLAAKLSDSWIDEYVWPELQRVIDKPSREFISWIKRSLRRSDD